MKQASSEYVLLKGNCNWLLFFLLITDETLKNNFALDGSNVANTTKLLPISNRVEKPPKQLQVK